jgi:site-specific DNA-methyltransferase (adenine-specific)
MTVSLEHGDMLEVLPTLGRRFHAVVTDPPYHLTNNSGTRSPYPGQYTPIGKPKLPKGGFMGKQWDGGDIAFRPETWALVGSVMMPGAYLVAFAGTKGAHRMACAIEDAGFEIRDTLAWLYGSGFPKSHNVSKAMDRAAGVEREVVGEGPNASRRPRPGDGVTIHMPAGDPITAPATDAAREWEGWGTALKPAYEPIVLARWPMSGKTVAANLAEHRCGAINIDGCRVEGEPVPVFATSGGRKVTFDGRPQDVRQVGTHSKGRWPANVVHDGSEEVLAAFPQTQTNGNVTGSARYNGTSAQTYGQYSPRPAVGQNTDSGSAARFFYSAKADAGDRLQSKHPTVKPVDLMRWLVRLVTPKGGHVLDPFAGSGTTGMACMAEGFDCTLIEKEAEYAADIRRRIAHVSGHDAPLFAEAGI